MGCRRDSRLGLSGRWRTRRSRHHVVCEDLEIALGSGRMPAVRRYQQELATKGTKKFFVPFVANSLLGYLLDGPRLVPALGGTIKVNASGITSNVIGSTPTASPSNCTRMGTSEAISTHLPRMYTTS